MVVTPSWEHHQTELEQVCREVTSAAGPKDIDSVSRSKTPLSPQPSSLGFDSRSKNSHTFNAISAEKYVTMHYLL